MFEPEEPSTEARTVARAASRSGRDFDEWTAETLCRDAGLSALERASGYQIPKARWMEYRDAAECFEADPERGRLERLWIEIFHAISEAANLKPDTERTRNAVEWLVSHTPKQIEDFIALNRGEKI